MQITILGAGSWGSALAIAFSKIGEVKIWSRNKLQVESINITRQNYDYLPSSVYFDKQITATSDFLSAISDCDLVVIATPLVAMRQICQQIASTKLSADIIWVCKGFEARSGKLPHQILAESIDTKNYGALLGPSFAAEVAQELPTAMVIASENSQFATKWATLLNKVDNLRVYANNDLIGAEICGGVKNIVAIASGICDGLNLGANARAALITRSVVELVALVNAFGGNPLTVSGLSGIGDLILTCTGDLSRNRWVGMQLGIGKKLVDVLDAVGHVAEGVYAVQEVYQLSKKYQLNTPIVDCVYRIIYQDSSVRKEIKNLLNRDYKDEFILSNSAIGDNNV